MRSWLLPLALATAPLAADTVHLANGNTFEDVVAVEVGDQVRIQLSYGEIRLPAGSVARIERRSSGLEEYLERKAALLEAGGGSAGEWLELARWAQGRGLDYGLREAATVAAELDPGLPGLAPLMRGLGLVHDAELDRWLPYAEQMRRRGFILVDGVWLGPEEVAERRRLAREEAELELERRRLERAERTADLAEMLLVKEVLEESGEEPPVAAVATAGALGVGFVGGVPVVTTVPTAGFGVVGVGGASRIGPPPFQANNEAFPTLLTRQPGSLLPIRPSGRHHRGGVAKPSRRHP